MKSQRDNQIIEGIIAGDPFIINSFYQENLSFASRYIRAHYGNEEDVRDIFQDAMIIIYQKSILNLLHFNDSLEAYFFGICKNLWKNHLRKRNKIIYDNILLEYKIDEAYFSDQPNIEKDLLSDIYKKYVLKLGDAKKELILLSMEGKSTKEISKITGYTEGYARKKKCNSKNDLKRMIRKDPIYKELVSV
ncbi:RNA polymerase sigma factor [Aquimarina latercula]|uniref:RNA polymerase sigma factor n=1 Tax=Aquimarina latercula TaxID=987 RepID=UPI00041155B0|nr:sigma-70 family RNA polymerase sigma factor [Aquimarina latercula]